MRSVVVCPHCRQQKDSHITINSDEGVLPPEDGDFSVCSGCAEVGVFEVDGEDVRIRLPTDEEQKLIDNHPEIQDAVVFAMRLKQAIMKRRENGR